MDHLLITCGSCYDELRRATFYEPPHDIRHRQAGPWNVSQAGGHHRAPLASE